MCTPASTALFAWHCVQVRYRHIRQAAIPARVVLGTAVFCDQSNQYLVYEFPFCAMHMRVSSVSLPYLQNRLPSLIMSAILAQYSSLCDHLVSSTHISCKKRGGGGGCGGEGITTKV